MTRKSSLVPTVILQPDVSNLGTDTLRGWTQTETSGQRGVHGLPHLHACVQVHMCAHTHIHATHTTYMLHTLCTHTAQQWRGTGNRKRPGDELAQSLPTRFFEGLCFPPQLHSVPTHRHEGPTGRLHPGALRAWACWPRGWPKLPVPPGAQVTSRVATCANCSGIFSSETWQGQPPHTRHPLGVRAGS